jgi:exonuclease SbcD
MKILHTSDWHLGRSLYGRKRYEEFAAFLEWLADLIEQKDIDALLVSGDVFDTSTPSNKAQELYYRFLCKVANSCCRNVVVIAGNHDSPSFLNAPKALLRTLNVHVVGAMTPLPEDEVIVLRDGENYPEAIVCAVPYLRDRDIRTVEAGETIEDKNLKLMDGLRNHYDAVCSIAEQQRKEMGNIPIIAMGHLFTAGGKTIEGDGVRELHVGSLAHVVADAFPDCIDYMALGHLHIAQRVGQSEHIRYSGSPIPMGYGEAKKKKEVIRVEFGNTGPTIQSIAVPCFQPLERLSGSLEEIQRGIEELRHAKSNAWLEIEYTGSEIMGNLRELIDATLEGASMEIRRIKNKRVVDRILNRTNENETLDDLDVKDVFARCLEAHDVSQEERSEMIGTYNEIITSLHEIDQNAE